MSDSQIARLLSSAKYQFQPQTKRDVANVLSLYRNLKPMLEKCTLPNGTKRELLCLKGTIPVSYRSSFYNIPINMWISHNHPYSAPICWVNPTKDMTIKVSKHVDSSGRIYLPYLSDWNSSTSDLVGVIQVMIILFGETPPLYSKPKNTPTESTTGVSSSTPYPPYPTYPSQYPYSNVYPAMNPISTSTTSYPAPTEGAANPPYPFSNYSMVQGYNPQSVTNNINSMNTNTISKEHIRLSLLSAVEDKLKSRSKEVISQYNAEIDVLKKTGADLKNGRSTLDQIFTDYDNYLSELSKCKDKINSKDTKIAEYLIKLESSKDKLNIDEYFGPIQPLYKQLLNAFVEENSIVDTVFYLNEALQKGVIDLEVFTKNVRELSRRQFMMRALIKLCREKAGLPT